MKVTFKDDCTRVVKVMQQIFIVKSPFDKIDWHKKECANQLIRSNRLKRKKAKPQTMNLKTKIEITGHSKVQSSDEMQSLSQSQSLVCDHQKQMQGEDHDGCALALLVRSKFNGKATKMLVMLKIFASIQYSNYVIGDWQV